MSKKRFQAEIRTLHYATLHWWWADAYVHNSDYTFRVNDAMSAAVAKVCKEFDVTENTRFCCQFEGVEIYGEDIQSVRAAGAKLDRALSRFKHVHPLD